jgi:allantoicase
MSAHGPSAPAFADLADLASASLGARAVAASDEFFAEKDNLLKPEIPVFVPGRFTDRGKWMDGWETRRRRGPGYDWCLVRLGRPGSIAGVCIDTAHFNGNQPESCTLDAIEAPDDAAARHALPAVPDAPGPWVQVVGPTPLGPSRPHFVPARADAAGRRFTHVRLNILPDGGVARLRVYGRAMPEWATVPREDGLVDLAAVANGGLVVAASDMHFGSRHNLIMPGPAATMGDGWETRRRRGLDWERGPVAEHDWAVIRLARRGMVRRIEVDTSHFKGNFPESCAVDGIDTGPDAVPGIPADPARWPWAPLLPRSLLKGDTRHVYDRHLASPGPWTHLRLRIFPDGGVARFRAWGEATE